MEAEPSTGQSSGDHFTLQKSEPSSPAPTGAFYERGSGVPTEQPNIPGGSSNGFDLPDVPGPNLPSIGPKEISPVVTILELLWKFDQHARPEGTPPNVGPLPKSETTDMYKYQEKPTPKEWIVYEINYMVKDKTSSAFIDQDIYKFGISGQNFNTDGTHPRPEKQIRSLTIDEFAIIGSDEFSEYRVYNAPKIVARNLTQLQAEAIEQQLVNAYHAKHGKSPEGNLKPLPDVIRGRTRKKFNKLDKKTINNIINFTNKHINP